MKNIVKDPGPNSKGSENILLLSGIGIAVFFWFVDSLVDTFVFNEGDFLENILAPDPMDIWMRSLVVALILWITVYGRRHIIALKQAEEKIREYKVHLEKMVDKRTAALKVANEELVKEIAERKSTEELLRESDVKLLRAQKMEVMGKMAGGVAHEVRNPLNSLMALTEALFVEIGDNVQAKPYIKHIQDQVDRLSVLMSDLLCLGKPIETSGLEQADLYAVCRDAALLCSNINDGDPNKFRIVQPQNAGPLMVIADSVRLTQVFRNLLENAFRHTIREEEVQIIIDGPPYIDGKCKVKVVDRGTGVPEGCLKQVFEPFFSTRRGGSGLGLCIVKTIVESYGGTIDIYNNDPPPGCSVDVSLPIVEKGQL